MSRFKIVLYKPLIPGNTGSIGRTCVALDLELILIKPYGFNLDEKEVRRAGLDYWKHVKLKEFDNWNSFFQEDAMKVLKLDVAIKPRRLAVKMGYLFAPDY